jgi:hypothetical protein
VDSPCGLPTGPAVTHRPQSNGRKETTEKTGLAKAHKNIDSSTRSGCLPGASQTGSITPIIPGAITPIGDTVRVSHDIRERYWRDAVLTLDTWPLVFICGANHVEFFSEQLRSSGVRVLVAFEDWAPQAQVLRTGAG